MLPLKIILCQFDIIWENAKANRDKLSQLFYDIPIGSADLLILPEMFTTGFSMNSSKLAEEMDGPSTKWMKQMANRLQMAITGSLIISDQGQYFNRLLWIEPENDKIHYYDKKHLFTLAGEQKHYQPGNRKLQVSWKGWKISFYICYDLRFPVWTRNTMNDDLIVYVANFPEKREKAWNSLLPARAIENQCFVIGLNRVGLDGNGIPHRGDSGVFDYEGQKILDLKNTEQLANLTLDYHKIQVYRRAYPFLEDQDHFNLD